MMDEKLERKLKRMKNFSSAVLFLTGCLLLNPDSNKFYTLAYIGIIFVLAIHINKTIGLVFKEFGETLELFDFGLSEIATLFLLGVMVIVFLVSLCIFLF